MLSKLNNLLDTFIERAMYQLELWKWEREKKREGFPPEWFLSDEQIQQLDERENGKKPIQDI